MNVFFELLHRFLGGKYYKMTYVVTIDRQNTDKIQKLIDNIAKSVTLQKLQKRIDNKRSKEIEEEEYLILVYLFHETLG